MIADLCGMLKREDLNESTAGKAIKEPSTARENDIIMTYKLKEECVYRKRGLEHDL